MADSTTINVYQTTANFQSAYSQELAETVDPQGRTIAQKQSRLVGPWGNFVDNFIRDVQAAMAETWIDGILRLGTRRVLLVDSDPEGADEAEPGSLALRDNGQAYLKTSGSGNTGWSELRTGLSGYVLAYNSGYTALQGEDSTGAVRKLARLVSNTESRFGDEAVAETVADALSNVWFRTGGTRRWRVNSAGDLLPNASGYDIATSGTPVDTGYFGIVVASSYVTINGTRYYSDSGSPDGVLDAPEGSHYTDEDTGYRYRNTSSGSGTTWTSLERVPWSMQGYGDYTGTSLRYLSFFGVTPSAVFGDSFTMPLPTGDVIERITVRSASTNTVEWDVLTGTSSLTSRATDTHDHSTSRVRTFDVGYTALTDEFVAVTIDPVGAGTDYYFLLQGYRLLG